MTTELNRKLTKENRYMSEFIDDKNLKAEFEEFKEISREKEITHKTCTACGFTGNKKDNFYVLRDTISVIYHSKCKTCYKKVRNDFFASKHEDGNVRHRKVCREDLEITKDMTSREYNNYKSKKRYHTDESFRIYTAVKHFKKYHKDNPNIAEYFDTFKLLDIKTPEQLQEVKDKIAEIKKLTGYNQITKKRLVAGVKNLI